MPKEGFIERALYMNSARKSAVQSDPINPFMIETVHNLRRHQDLVSNAVARSLQNPATPSPYEAKTIARGVAVNVRILPTEVLSPSWFNRRGLISMVGELSSSAMWNDILQKMPRTKKEEQQIQENNIDLELAALNIAINNSGFVTSAVTLGLLGAAMGSRVKYSGRHIFNLFNKDFATTIGNRYQTRAGSVDEFMERVSELIPNPDTHDSVNGNTLYHELVKHNTFEGTRRTCPARYLTLLSLQQWGRILDTDAAYRQRFMEAVSK
jgi:hypothetical protein